MDAFYSYIVAATRDIAYVRLFVNLLVTVLHGSVYIVVVNLRKIVYVD